MTWIANPLKAPIGRAALLIMLLGFMTASSGCYYYKSVGYHRTAKKSKKFRKELRSTLDPNRYVIVHQGNDMWHLDDIFAFIPYGKGCDPKLDSIYGNAEDVDSLCAFYHNKYEEKGRRAVRYFIDDQNYVVSQVHLYVDDNASYSTNSVTIPVSSIRRVEVYKQATFRSQWPWIAARICLEIILACASSQSSHSHSSHTPRSTSRAPHATHVPRSSR